MRMMMVFFPEVNILYGSDLFQRRPTGEFFTRQTVSEFVKVVQREKLNVKKVFMLHVGEMDWEEITKAAR